MNNQKARHIRPTTTTLEDLRSELDVIDEQLLETLANRIRCCLRIAEYKRTHHVPMMQPSRIGVVHSRAAEFAANNDIDTTFIKQFYDLIIGEICRLEDEVIDGDRPGSEPEGN